MNGDQFIGKLTFLGIGWRINERFNRIRNSVHKTAVPTCRTCQVSLISKDQLALVCQNPRCKNLDKPLALEKPLDETRLLIVSMWEGEQRRKEKIQFLNFDQELIPLAQGEDSDSEYWCTVKLFQTIKGKMAMVLIGRKGHSSKVQFFVKDELNQVTFDQVGDLNPKELLMAFKAQFADGSVTETKLS